MLELALILLLAVIWLLYKIVDCAVKVIKRVLGIRIEEPPISEPVQVWYSDDEVEEEDSQDFWTDEEW